VSRLPGGGRRFNEFAGTNLDRLAGISDGIFAVSMTLLVLGLSASACLVSGPRYGVGAEFRTLHGGRGYDQDFVPQVAQRADQLRNVHVLPVLGAGSVMIENLHTMRSSAYADATRYEVRMASSLCGILWNEVSIGMVFKSSSAFSLTGESSISIVKPASSIMALYWKCLSLFV